MLAKTSFHSFIYPSIHSLIFVPGLLPGTGGMTNRGDTPPALKNFKHSDANWACLLCHVGAGTGVLFFFKVLPTYDNSTIVEIKTLELRNKKEKGYLYLLFKRKLLSERSSSFLGASLTPGAAGVVFASVQRARAASCQACSAISLCFVGWYILM